MSTTSDAKLTFCSISTVSYLPAIRVLRQSTKATHATSKHLTLVVDATQRELQAHGCDETYVSLLEVFDAKMLLQLAFYYSAFELCCALKPWFVAFVLQTYKPEVVVYADSDLLFYAPIPMDALPSDEQAVALTPQFLTPTNINDEKQLFLTFGTFNAGYFAVRNNEAGRHIMNYWWERTQAHGLNDLSRRMFLDQLWLNLFPALFSDHIRVVRHFGCNVAFWNLYERELSERAGEVIVNQAQPLVFFHWSSLIVGNSTRIFSNTSADPERLSTTQVTLLRKLSNGYSTALLEQGYQSAKRLPYRFGKFRDGGEISAAMRLVYYNLLNAAGSHVDPGAPLEDPFAESRKLRQMLTRSEIKRFWKRLRGRTR